MTEDIKIKRGSGNVYKDLGFKNPEEMRKKAGIVANIYNVFKESLGIDPTELHQITCGHFEIYTLEKLNNILHKLSQLKGKSDE